MIILQPMMPFQPWEKIYRLDGWFLETPEQMVPNLVKFTEKQNNDCGYKLEYQLENPHPFVNKSDIFINFSRYLMKRDFWNFDTKHYPLKIMEMPVINSEVNAITYKFIST